MPSLFKGLKEKLTGSRKTETPSRGERERGRHRDRSRNSSWTSESSRSISSGHNYDAGPSSQSRNRDTREAVRTSEPILGSTRRDQAKDDKWGGVYDDPGRRHTESPTREKSGIKIGKYRLNIEKSPTSKSKSSRDKISETTDRRRSGGFSVTSPRSSRDQPRKSKDFHIRSKGLNLHITTESPSRDQGRDGRHRSTDHRPRSRERSRNRDVSPGRSTESHRHRRRKSSHPKELSRHGPHHRPSSDRIRPPFPPFPPIPPIPSIPPIPPRIRNDIFVVDKKYNDRAEHDRRKDAERLRRDKEILERQKEAANRAAQASRRQMEEETARKRRERVTREREEEERQNAEREQRKDRERRERENRARSAAVSPPKKNLPRLTAENLKAREGDEDFVNGEQTSSLNRPFGDMTRSFLEGMVCADEVAEVERRKMEKRLREGGKRVE